MKRFACFVIAVLACQLAWDAAPQGTFPLRSYKIYRKASVISSWKLAGITNATNTTYKLYNKGWYRVSAVDTQNTEGKPSNPVIFNGRSCGSVSLWNYGTNDGGGSTGNTRLLKWKLDDIPPSKPTGLQQAN